MIEAGFSEGTGGSVEVAMDGFGLGVLAWAVAGCQVADPAAFDFVADDRPAESVKVVTLANLGVHGEVRAEGFANLFSKLERLSTSGKIGIIDGLQDRKHVGFALVGGTNLMGILIAPVPHPVTRRSGKK